MANIQIAKKGGCILKNMSRSATALGLILASSAYGQDTSPPVEARGLGISDASEIVVTAQRRSERLQDVPISVTAFSAGSLRQKEVSNLLNIGRFTPNVEISTGRTDGGGSSLSAFIRGVGQQDFAFPTDPGVGVYLDDVYLARTIGSTIDLSDVERVEVLRGPQGTLYGKNTVGGAIKIVTRRPEVSGAWKGELEGTIGRYNRTDFKAYATGPLIEDRLGLKLAIAGIRRDGYGERLTQDFDLGDQGKLVGRAALRWTPDASLDITLQGDYQHQRQHGNVLTMINRIPSDSDLSGLASLLKSLPGSPFANAIDPTPQNPFLFDDFYNAFIVPTLNPRLGLPADTRFDGRFLTRDLYRSFGTGPSRDDNDIWGAQLNIAKELSDNVTLRSITAYRQIKAYIPGDGDNTPYPIIQTESHYRQHQISQELQLGGKAFDDRLDFLVGGYYLHEYGKDTNNVSVFSGLYSVLNPVAPFLYAPTPCIGSGTTADCTSGAFDIDYRLINKIHTDSLAGFAQGTFHVNDRLALTAGGRYSTEKKTYRQDFALRNVPDPKFGPGLPGYTGSEPPIDGPDGLARAVGPRKLQDRWSNFTPRLGVDFKLTPRNLLYASWSKGFKSGGWSPRPSQQNNTNLSYGPEKLSTFEVGSKNSLLGGKLIANLSAFHSDYSDIQVTTIGSGPNGTLIQLVRNIGKAELYGVEAELTARPTNRLELNFAGGWLHSKWKKFNRSACNTAVFDATAGNYCDVDLSLDDHLVDSPRYTANFGAQYTLPLGQAGAVTMRSDASYRAKTWKDPYNLGRGPNAFGQLDPRATLPANGYYVISKRELSQEAFWLVNIRLAWSDSEDRYEIAGGISNLLNKKYITAIVPSTTVGYDVGVPGRPREWSLSVRYSF